MRGSTRPNEDEEIEALRRSMRPDPKRTFVTLFAILTIGIGGILVSVAHGCRSNEEQWRSRAAYPADQAGGSPFITINHRVGASHDVARQAVAIRTRKYPEPNGVFSQGSGFLIADGMVLTAAHVFTSISGSERDPVTVRCDDVERGGTVAAIDALRDVAAITAPGCTGRKIPFSYETVGISDGLHAAGYDFEPGNVVARWYQFDTSAVPGVEPDPQRGDIEPALANRILEMRRRSIPPFLALAGALDPGNSGSAVFDDRGRVVGMLVAADSRFNRSYCVSSPVIADFLRNNGLPVP